MVAIVCAASLTYQRRALGENGVSNGAIVQTSVPNAVDVASEASMEVVSVPEPQMIEFIRELCRLLSTSPLTVAEVAEHVGTITMRFHGDTTFIVTPSIPEFRRARVSSNPADDDLITVDLDLTELSEHTLHVVHKAFGDYDMGVRFNPLAPAGGIFTVDLYPDAPRRCRILVLFQDHRGGSITTITLQRNLRWPRPSNRE